MFAYEFDILLTMNPSIFNFNFFPCRELTPVEKELKSIKFWNPTNPKVRNKNKFSAQKLKLGVLPVQALDTGRVLK